jgi:hypothetical protein
MVLCEEIVQWIIACGGHISSDPVGSSGHAHAISVQRLNSAASSSPRTSSASPRRSTITPHQRAHGAADWKMLKQLSHQLGKNLGGEGNRSSPLSPSDLAGWCIFCFCVHFCIECACQLRSSFAISRLILERLSANSFSQTNQPIKTKRFQRY